MRALADHRDDWVMKKEIYHKEIAPNYQIEFVIEDKASVVKMWRELNLVCLQCDWGDF
jgi:hypothetical protein